MMIRYEVLGIIFMIIMASTTLIAGIQIQSYLPPSIDRNKIAKIQTVLPEIDQIYKDYAKQNHFLGYAYGIIVDGQLIHAIGSGFADLEKKVPITPQSMFRIASMTKSFTAMAILKLRDENKLKLDDPVYLYIPEIRDQKLTNDSPDITIRDLLTHSAGLPTDDPWADRKLQESDEDLITLLKKGIYFSTASRTTYEYSNLGYTMLGYIIKKITGIPYEKFILEMICKPILMEKIFWEFTEVPLSELVHGYKWESEKWKKQEMLNSGIFGAMGGMITSIEMFSRYVAMHLSAWPPRNDLEVSPIKRSSIREMHQPFIFKELITDKYFDGRERILANAYGYGLNWSRDLLGRIFVGHSGGLPGFGSNWLIMPEYGLGIVLFANNTYAPAAKVNFDVLDKLIRDADLKPASLPSSDILQDRKNDLVQLLPDWEQASKTNIFAPNFFLDNSLDTLTTETKQLFASLGKITSISELIPQNQLRGQFVIQGEKGSLQVKFSLTPENPPLIQECRIKKILQ